MRWRWFGWFRPPPLPMAECPRCSGLGLAIASLSATNATTHCVLCADSPGEVPEEMAAVYRMFSGPPAQPFTQARGLDIEGLKCAFSVRPPGYGDAMELRIVGLDRDYRIHALGERAAGVSKAFAKTGVTVAEFSKKLSVLASKMPKF